MIGLLKKLLPFTRTQETRGKPLNRAEVVFKTGIHAPLSLGLNIRVYRGGEHIETRDYSEHELQNLSRQGYTPHDTTGTLTPGLFTVDEAGSRTVR